MIMRKIINNLFRFLDKSNPTQKEEANQGLNPIVIYRNIKIIKEDCYFITEGLLPIVESEFRVLHQNDSCINVLQYLIDYVLDDSPEIVPDQTFGYHSWALKFCQTNDSHYLEIWEAKSDGSGFVEGVDYALKVTQEQINKCNEYDVLPTFPNFNQKIVISKGVYEGYNVDAVRYPSPEHMSGWWLITDLYDGNTDSLMVVHFYHVAFERPELLEFLALPFGFRFYKDDAIEDIWFDEEALDN